MGWRFWEFGDLGIFLKFDDVRCYSSIYFATIEYMYFTFLTSMAQTNSTQLTINSFCKSSTGSHCNNRFTTTPVAQAANINEPRRQIRGKSTNRVRTLVTKHDCRWMTHKTEPAELYVYSSLYDDPARSSRPKLRGIYCTRKHIFHDCRPSSRFPSVPCEQASLFFFRSLYIIGSA